MKIYSDKSYRFDHPTDAEHSASVQPGFAVVPDWVTDSTMFKLAQKDGDVQVIESKQDEITAEKGAGKPNPRKNAGASEDPNGDQTPPTE